MGDSSDEDPLGSLPEIEQPMENPSDPYDDEMDSDEESDSALEDSTTGDEDDDDEKPHIYKEDIVVKENFVISGHQNGISRYDRRRERVVWQGYEEIAVDKQMGKLIKARSNQEMRDILSKMMRLGQRSADIAERRSELHQHAEDAVAQCETDLAEFDGDDGDERMKFEASLRQAKLAREATLKQKEAAIAVAKAYKDEKRAMVKNVEKITNEKRLNGLKQRAEQQESEAEVDEGEVGASSSLKEMVSNAAARKKMARANLGMRLKEAKMAKKKYKASVRKVMKVRNLNPLKQYKNSFDFNIAALFEAINRRTDARLEKAKAQMQLNTATARQRAAEAISEKSGRLYEEARRLARMSSGSSTGSTSTGSTSDAATAPTCAIMKRCYVAVKRLTEEEIAQYGKRTCSGHSGLRRRRMKKTVKKVVIDSAAEEKLVDVFKACSIEMDAAAISAASAASDDESDIVLVDVVPPKSVMAVYGPEPAMAEGGVRLMTIAPAMMTVAEIPAENIDGFRWLPYDLKTKKIDYDDAEFNEASLYSPGIDERKYLHLIRQRLSTQGSGTQEPTAIFQEQPSTWEPTATQMALSRREEKELDDQLEKRRAEWVRPEELSD